MQSHISHMSYTIPLSYKDQKPQPFFLLSSILGSWQLTGAVFQSVQSQLQGLLLLDGTWILAWYLYHLTTSQHGRAAAQLWAFVTLKTISHKTRELQLKLFLLCACWKTQLWLFKETWFRQVNAWDWPICVHMCAVHIPHPERDWMSTKSVWPFKG